MPCPRCNCERQTKDGIIKGRQRYKCKEFNYCYTIQQKSTGKSKELKRYSYYASVGKVLLRN